MPVYNDLPHVWKRPVRIIQRTLLPQETAEMMAYASISIDDAKRWQAKGWLSFNVSEYEKLDEPEFFELIFVRNIARSGLSDEQIDQWLSKLQKPYRYEPTRIAYSFALGWVECPPDTSEDELKESDIESWIEAQALLGERETLVRILGTVSRWLLETKEKK